MSSARTTGLLVGLALGIVWMWLGFGAALLVGILGLLGWAIGAVIGAFSMEGASFADFFPWRRGAPM
jgi:hypothetical protein